jgi:hypothetical protein
VLAGHVDRRAKSDRAVRAGSVAGLPSGLCSPDGNRNRDLRRAVMVSGFDEPPGDEARIARLVAELGDLPFEEREAVISSLSADDRAAVWDALLEESETVVPEDDEELGGEA